MKIRISFVSNSSSSSFCVMGYECPQKWGRSELMKALGYNFDSGSQEEDDAFYDCQNSLRGRLTILDPEDYSGDGYFIGVSLVQSNDNGLDDFEISYQEVITMIHKQLNDMKMATNSLKFVSGTTFC